MMKSDSNTGRLCAALVILILLYGSGRCLSKPTFSKPHGIYEEGLVTVAIIPSVSGAQVRYTTDGSVPTASSTLYSEPLVIAATTILRAVEVTDGEVSEPSTVSYIFAESVLSQSAAPEGYPAQWGPFAYNEGNAPADYEMDPELTGDPEYRLKIVEGLKDIPVLSIVTDRNHLFNDELDEQRGGIYIYTGTYEGTANGVGKGWTRPVSVELFGVSSRAAANPQTLDMTVDCGLRLHGGSSRVSDKSPKHSFRLVFKKEYGEGKLNYPLFGEDEPTGYDQLILRSHFNLTWPHWGDERQYAQYTRDVWARRMQRKMGYLSNNALYVNLFLNGMYWGLYNIAERVDDQFCKLHLGGKKSDYDVIKVEDDNGDVIEASEGDLEAWHKMEELLDDCHHESEYRQLQRLLDIDAFIDYMLLNQMGGNMDWGRHNWFAVNKKGDDSKGFQFVCWDSEALFMGVNDVVMGLNNKGCPTEFFNLLLRNEDFSDRYISRAGKLLAADGLLGPVSAVEVWDSLYHTIENAIYAESARWGDYRKDTHPYYNKGPLYTVEEHYLPERDRLLTMYFPERSQKALKGIVSYVNDVTGRNYTGIHRVQEAGSDDGSVYYDLSGKAVSTPHKGIIIRKGKKCLVVSGETHGNLSP